MIGGTGPTGPSILAGSAGPGLRRDDLPPRARTSRRTWPEVRHIHGDPHFRESIDEAVGTGSFDVVVAAYGRTALLAEASRAGAPGTSSRSAAAPGTPGFNEPHRVFPGYGPAQPLREDSPLVTLPRCRGIPRAIKFAQKIVRTEEAGLRGATGGDGHLVYPIAYGPAERLALGEWSVVDRAAGTAVAGW